MFKCIDKDIVFGDYNHGFVELYNPWVGNDSRVTREQTVAVVASISYGNDATNNPAGLYRRLIELKHLSCFEFIHTGEFLGFSINDSLRHKRFGTHDSFVKNDEDLLQMQNNIKENIACFKMKVPIFLARQFMRHRAFSYLEMSRRYVKDSKVPFEFLTDNNDQTKAFNETCVTEYYRRIETGQKPEEARGCIPTDVFTTYFAQADSEGLVNFFRLRTDPHAQVFIREVAWAMANLIKKQQPDLYKKIEGSLYKV